MALPTAPIAAGSLIGGYAVARFTGVRPLGGVVLAGAGAHLARRWRARAGTPVAGVLLATYAGAFGASHPLSRRIGAWPSVLSAAGLSALLSALLADHRRARRHGC